MTQPATAEPATQVNQQALSLRSTRQSTDSHSALDNDNDNFDKWQQEWTVEDLKCKSSV